MSDTSTPKSKVKEHLRQSMEDKCSKIGGWEIFFGMNDSMIRILTPVEEVLTPVPGMVTPTPEHSGNTITWTLSNPSDFPESSSEQNSTDIDKYSKRRVLELDIGSHRESNKTSNITTENKSDVTAKPKRRNKKTKPSNGQKQDSSGTQGNDSNVMTFRQPDGEQFKDNLEQNTKIRRERVIVQRFERNGHLVTKIDLPAIQLSHKNDSDERKQNKSKRKSSSASCLDYTNISVKCTLPPLDERKPSAGKKDRKTKSTETNQVTVIPSVREEHKSTRRETGTQGVVLPPIKSTSGRENLVQFTRSAHLQHTQERQNSATKPSKNISSVQNTRLVSVDTKTLPSIDNNSGKESVLSRRSRGTRGSR